MKTELAELVHICRVHEGIVIFALSTSVPHSFRMRLICSNLMARIKYIW
jgi:hypothetical protein